MAEIRGTDGSDWLVGTDEDDWLKGYRGSDTLLGGPGDDYLDADRIPNWGSTIAPAYNVLIGGVGDDVLTGGAGWDTLLGGQGNDSLYGGGQNILKGEDGNDTLQWDESAIRLDGGRGTDRLLVEWHLNLQRVEDGKLVDIEVIETDPWWSSANKLTLTRKDILAISSTDTLTVIGDVYDSVNIVGDYRDLGVSGDFHHYKLGAATLLVDTDIPMATINGTTSSDSLVGTAKDDGLWGYQGNDTLIGGAGDDYLNAGDNFSVGGENPIPRSGDDLLWGGAGDDTLNGGRGSDRLYGGPGNDFLYYLYYRGPGVLNGEDGNDTLSWDAAATRLDGGRGTDTLRVHSWGLDLRDVPDDKLVDIEIIDINISSGGGNKLTLTRKDILAISSTTDTLQVVGDEYLYDIVVNIVGNYRDLGVSGDFHRYSVYGAVLLVDTDFTVI